MELTTELVTAWLTIESNYSAGKFGTDQSDTLRKYMLGHESSFGGQAGMYWNRLQQARETDQPLRAAQAAGKLASCTRGLWATLQAFDRRSDAGASRLGIQMAGRHLAADNYPDAKVYIDRSDFWETPVGLGLSYLERAIQERGLERPARVGHLIRAGQVLQDAVSVMAVQFDETLAVAGNLPQPGQSSGNLVVWEV